MERDEAGTLERLKANRSAIFDPCVAAHGGRIVKLMGDGALVEFASVVAAVELRARDPGRDRARRAGSAEPKRIRYRIGINLGDVIVEGDDIYGDGVNVAARLQALRRAGRHRAVAHRARPGRGQGDVRVRRSRRAHGEEHRAAGARVRAAPRSRAKTRGRPTRRSAERLSICVLPFANMSGDPEQEYFSDGITEDIITDLSKVSALCGRVAQHRLHVQGQARRRARRSRAQLEGQRTCSKAACARPAIACASPRS